MNDFFGKLLGFFSAILGIFFAGKFYADNKRKEKISSAEKEINKKEKEIKDEVNNSSLESLVDNNNKKHAGK